MDISSVSLAANSLQPRSVAPSVSNPLETSGQPASSPNNSSSINAGQPDSLPARINDPLSPEAGQRSDNRGDAGSAAQSSGNLAQQRGGDNRADGELELEELSQVRQLSQRDREVRAHEAAHAAAGGSLTGAPSYSYTTGPDGRRYATSGEVSVESPRGSTPEETIERARTVIEAALAPAEPSPQDLRIAAQARAELIAAQAELERSERQQLEQAEQQETAQQPELSLASTATDTESDVSPGAGTNVTTDELTPSVSTERPSQLGTDEELNAAEQREVEQAERAARAEQLQEEQQARQERIAQAQQEFAQELAELNRRIQQVQQQLIETGQVDPLSLLQGSLLDTTA
ncbi:hypothetical protein DV711_05860 [Motiliproteus coralliicola]|uniref:Catalase n=1 Tax=Motiliproteus coralliicola TaxID=2283196 RepID=A0A369WTS4_9GAMM|nr:putative metalloprotease CJM1_0395 family protein [Motiliproteus coralliicola]RDE25082.1 hypothetical protein DV711_05860 [Motiliproteus coralliicola]